MSYQVYVLQLIDGTTVQMAEDYDLPVEKGIVGQFSKAAQDDVFVRSVCVITGFDVRIAVEIQIAFPADPVRIVVVPVIQIALKIQGYLFQIAGAGAQFCMFPGLVQCRKKHSGKYCNNSNYD